MENTLYRRSMAATSESSNIWSRSTNQSATSATREKSPKQPRNRFLRQFSPARFSADRETAPQRQEPRSRSAGLSFQHIARRLESRLEKQKMKMKEEIGAWKRRIRESSAGRAEHNKTVTLLSVEPLISSGPDVNPCVTYRAQMRILGDDNREHVWQTEPFTLDSLLSIVVSTRIANVTKWCSSRSTKRADLMPICTTLMCVFRAAALWSFVCFMAWKMTSSIQPWARSMVQWCAPARLSAASEALPADWVAATVVTALSMSCAAGLFAGIAEISFLPAKAVLQFERKDETAQVREQMELLLASNDCLRTLEVCNFLNLGMATYYNSSETQKEGRCFYRRHESSETYFMRARRTRWSLLFFSFDCRCQLRAGRGSTQSERWLVLLKDGLALFRSIMDRDPTDMLFFDTSFSLFRDDEDCVLVCGASWLLELDFRGSRQESIQGWCNAITLTAQLSPRTREQRFGSFAPIRYPAEPKHGDRHMLRRSLARFLIGGKATFKMIAESIQLAKHEIFILGFWVTPHLPLVREGNVLPDNSDPRLSALLRVAADRGVRVFVLVFHEIPMFLPHDSEYLEAELQHPNIFLVRHRSRFDSNRLWTHHEKVVVVDQQLAFLGGIDIALGRYDDARHRLGDVPAHVWEDQDYSNPRIKDFSDVRKKGDTLDRREQHRMPWQDVQCMLLGRPAQDVVRHCIERWNHAKTTKPQYAKFPTALLQRKTAVCNASIMGLPSQREANHWPPEISEWRDCTVQLVRSVGRWSAGTRTESSVHAAYCDLVQDAENFIYIENQFFVSGMEGDDMMGNRVAEALYRRVVRAHARRQTFHVMIVLPLLPLLDGNLAPNASSNVLFVMHWQYRTLRALRNRLEEAGVDPDAFFSIYGLRTWDFLGGENVKTEQIYVHSKVMVIDDRVAVVGSANINDRSLLGMRDSEIDVIIHDTEGRLPAAAAAAAAADSVPTHNGTSASQLREALFAQHLGCSEEDLRGRFADPASAKSVQDMRGIANRNTAIYESVFGALPSDSIRSWSELVSRRASGGQRTGDSTRLPTATEAAALSDVQGHLVNFPLDFLVEEDLAPPTFSVGGLTPDCFT